MATVFEREALLQEPVDGKVRCNVCERRCILILGAKGWCRTRTNRDGKLYTLTYGAISSLAVNPIEKKPFYHFYPGSFNLTAGSWSCNFGCPWCQNWDISKTVPATGMQYLAPESFVSLAVEEGCQGTSISFNEPTLSLEWSLEVFPLARQRGLYNTFVTNGYMTPEALGLLIEAGLDAMNVDIKGGADAVWKYCRGVDVEKVWAICRLCRERGVHLEITTLVIPGVNDASDDLSAIAGRIASELGRDVPWHVSAYYPAYRFNAPPTPPRTLIQAWNLGRRAGLEYVYTGNLPDDPHANTICPSCGETLIRRRGFSVIENKLRNGHCPACGRAISGVWG